ncbi:N-acetylmuramoyl-L-alanine amidase [Halobacillus sp. Marseille-P3879]|uniref:N-acetylmuramoyl-L-alanine amidase family protein n=1 Tax=Halobacillus sp. Marseille-P3879 TaxID=2045014 RepID=UPI000C7D5140|nr:N-acetylmuramoyl-L-alanine amidase [Halobacillus sp. Marseille-P3879]
MFKLYLDPGHGGSDPGATAHGLEEKNLNLDIALEIRNMLRDEYTGVEVRMSRSTDVFVSLAARTNDANTWGADYFLSVHINAFNGSARGYEDYIHTSLADSSVTARYQEIMHEEITALNELPDRGMKKANFHVLRESAMPALLTENGFIDNDRDAVKLRDPLWRHKVARGHVNGLARAFNLKKKADIHRVIVDGTQVGAYQNHQNVLDAVNRYLNNSQKIVVEKV